MNQTIEELKERYYKLVAQRGQTVYSSWVKNGAKSKQIVIKANEYAFDKRLKNDTSYRFRALAFAFALEIRITKRYATLLRKIIYLFPYLREKDVLRLMKRVLGFSWETPLRDMIAVETQKLLMKLLALKDNESTGGGKRSKMGDLTDLTVEPGLNGLLDELSQNESVDMDLLLDEAELFGVESEQTFVERQETMREQISVNELTLTEDGVEREDAEPLHDERLEREETAKKDGKQTEIKAEPKQEQKSVANTSILAETMIVKEGQAQDSVSQSPFPVFRDNDTARSMGDKNFTASETTQIVGNDRETGVGTNGGFDNGERNGEERMKDAFPVFKGQEKFSEPSKSVEQPAQKQEISQDKNTVQKEVTLERKPVEQKEPQKPVETMEVSAENRARRELNITMRDEERIAIAMQVKMQAQEIMAQEEAEWREKISVEQGQEPTETSARVDQNQSKGVVVEHKP